MGVIVHSTGLTISFIVVNDMKLSFLPPITLTALSKTLIYTTLIISLVLASTNASLISFHSYLIFALDKGTYEWMLDQRVDAVKKRTKRELESVKVAPINEDVDQPTTPSNVNILT
jgi:hypothetical protein